MPKKITNLFFAGALAFVLVAPTYAQAQGAAAASTPLQSGIEQLKNNLFNFGEQTSLGSGAQEEDLKSTVANVINIVLGFLGIVAVIIIITSGFKWMTAGGNEQTITEARGHIKNAAIGLVIVFTSYIIVNFAVTQLSRATSGGDSSTEVPVPPGAGGS